MQYLDGTWFVYIVQCSDSSLYTGCSNHLFQRIDAHNSGDGAKYTRSRRPVQLMWFKACENKSVAFKEEARVKKLSRAQKQALLPYSWTNRKAHEFNKLLQIYQKIHPYPPPENVSEIDRVHFTSLMAIASPWWNVAPLLNDSGLAIGEDFIPSIAARNVLCGRYSWAIPTEKAIKKIIQYGPLVEMGAGSGYWAKLIKLLGGKITCYDRFPPPNGFNVWHSEGIRYFRINKGNPEVLARYDKRTLFLCWPPHGDKMASQCLHYWRGKHLIYIGEFYGTSANDEFFHQLENEFELIDGMEIPNWPGIHDKLTIWERK